MNNIIFMHVLDGLANLSHIIDKDNNLCQLNLTFSGNMKNLQVEISKN